MKREAFWRTLFSLLSIILICNNLQSQSYRATIDSLTRILAQTQEDDNKKVDLLNQISYAYRRTSPDSLLLFAKQANVMAQKLGYVGGLVVSFKNIGIGYYKVGAEPDSINYYYEKAYEYAEDTGDYYTQAACLNNIGLVYYRNQRYDEAISKFIEGVEVHEAKVKTPDRLKALMLANIANAYVELDFLQKAREYLKYALDLADDLGLSSIQSMYLDNYGKLLYNLGEHELGKTHFKRAIVLQEEMMDHLSLAQTLVRYGDILLEEGLASEAEELAVRALQLIDRYSLGVEKTNCLVLLSKVNLALQQTEEALHYALQATELATAMEDLNYLERCVDALANAFEQNGQYREALLQRKRYEEIQAQNISERTANAAAQAEARYKNDLQTERIFHLEQEKAKQHKRIRLLALMLFFFSLCIGTIWFLYRKHKENNRTIAQKNQELEKYIEQNMQLENFAFIASHDLKTPLRSIIGFTQLLQKRLNLKSSREVKEYLNYIIQGTTDMSILIDDLLNYSLVQNATVHLIEVNLRELTKKVVGQLKSEFDTKEVRVHYDIHTSKAVSDPVKLTQLLQNLVSNAIKFSKPGEMARVTISTWETSTHWKLVVADRGIGIEQEYFDRIFLIFKRLHNKSTYAGTGIGLAICRKIVQQLNGEIDLVSEVGHGSTFTVSLPKEPAGKVRKQDAVGLVASRSPGKKAPALLGK